MLNVVAGLVFHRDRSFLVGIIPRCTSNLWQLLVLMKTRLHAMKQTHFISKMKLAKEDDKAPTSWNLMGINRDTMLGIKYL